jgi:predicted Zn-dependent protease
MGPLRRILCPVLLIAAMWVLGGCEINPETGRVVFNVVPPEDEKAIGAEAHRQVLAEFGGVYYDPPLAAYVESVGRKVVEQSQNRNFDFRFTILDSPSINAFALPGGYIYVTRGLLALLSSEAELAGVLGHELAHVTAKHGAQRLSRMKAEERFCATFACDFELPVLSDMTSIGLDLAFSGFSQDQELEADELGIRYLERAGYDPHAMIHFLEKLKAQSDLEADIAGLTVAQRKARGYSSTHPLTEDRIARSSEIAGGDDQTGATLAREYLLNIDGLLYGSRREYGFVIGNSYLHPIRRIAFDVPDGYTLYPDSRRVTGVGPDGAIMLFEPSRRLVKGTVLDYLETVWAGDVELEDARAFDIGGMEAATGWMRRQTRHGFADFRLVAVRVGTGVIYRFLFIAPSSMMARLSEGMREITYSFREIGEIEAEQLQPLRIRIATASPGDSVSQLAAQNDFPDNAVRRFAVLNDLDPHSEIEAGRILKMVRE